MNLSDYRLTVDKGEEEHIPKYGIEQDARFFDLDSLVRMYGEEVVQRYFEKSRGGREGA